MFMKTGATSIQTKIISVFLVFSIIQVVVFFILIGATGIINGIFEQTYSSYNYLILNRGKVFSESLNNSRSGFVPVANSINIEINDYITENGGNVPTNTKQIEELLGSTVEYLIEFINSTKEVSGAFVLLEPTNTDQKGDCVYIRDNNFGANVRGTESKTYIRGPSSIAENFNIRLNYLWESKMDFAYIEKNFGLDFYEKPINALIEGGLTYRNTFYWSYPFDISNSDPLMITLTMPLVDLNNEPIGVCGFEVSSELLRKMLPYNELSTIQGVYILGDGKIGETNDNIFVNGVFDGLLTDDGLEVNSLSDTYDMSELKFNSSELDDYISLHSQIDLYGKTSYFSDELWFVNGILQKSEVMEYPKSVVFMLIIAEVIIMLLGVGYIIYISAKLTFPIKNLAVKVGKIDPEEVIVLPKTKITEIDELSNAVEVLSSAVAASASRLNSIINMVDVSIGGFEEHFMDNKVYLTDSVSRIMGLPAGTKSVSFPEWAAILNQFSFKKDGDVYKYTNPVTNEVKWYRLRTSEMGVNINGVIIDVTDEIEELRRVEHERDYDNLTNIYNRRAFIKKMRENIEKKEYKYGAMIFIDLDNLKFVNDNFGHDYGDAYLKLMAASLKEFEKYTGIISRMAGDEFIAFVPCEQEELGFKDHIVYILDNCKSREIPLPDGSKQKLRFSAGVAWYPTDSDDLETLVKYADYTMYKTKRNMKGSVGEFDIDGYNRQGLLSGKLEAFEKLIENREIHFIYQPIISAVDGEIYAYELLMRSKIPGLENPKEILTIARQQSKLYHIEYLCMYKMFEEYSKNQEIFSGKYIFFNTIPSIMFKNEDWRFFTDNYSEYFSNIVIEVTETVEFDEKILMEKNNRFKEMGCNIAIDDFGSGYNGDVLLVKINPDFVKIDMSLIRDVHLNEDKKNIISNLIGYCKRRNIKVVAEGVEQYAEVELLCSMNVDLFQGYYTGRPKDKPLDIEENIKKQIVELNNNLNKTSSL